MQVLEDPGFRRLASCLRGHRWADRFSAIRTPSSLAESSSSRRLPQRRCLHLQETCSRDHRLRFSAAGRNLERGLALNLQVPGFDNFTFSKTNVSSLAFIGERARPLSKEESCCNEDKHSRRRKCFQYQSTCIRSFASKQPSKDDDPKSHMQTENAPREGGPSLPPPSLPKSASKNKPLDPPFSDYPSRVVRPQESLQVKSLVVDAEAMAASSRKGRQRLIATEKNKDLYRHIVEIQNLQKEESRKKTAYNVYRALMGNVIICTGASRLLLTAVE